MRYNSFRNNRENRSNGPHGVTISICVTISQTISQNMGLSHTVGFRMMETSEKTHCYIARICHSRIKSENSSNEVARCRQGQTGYYVLIIRQNLGCHIPLHSERYETYVNMYMFINHVLHMSTVVHI